MLTSPRMSPRLGVNSEAETLFKWRNFIVNDGFDVGTETEGGETMKEDKGNWDGNRDDEKVRGGLGDGTVCANVCAITSSGFSWG